MSESNAPTAAPAKAGAAPSKPTLIPCVCKHCQHQFDVAKKPKHCPKCDVAYWWQAPKSADSKIPALFFDGGVKGGGWILQTHPERFIFADSASVKLHFKHAGVHLMPGVGNLTREEHELHQAQVKRCVDFAGPVAGWRAGLHSLNGGQSMVVTNNARLPVAKKGDWSELGEYFATLLSPAQEQMHFFLAWLALARQSLLRGDFRPAQMLALGGAAGSGKSFMGVVVEYLLGGRKAMPYDYMAGKTNFNGDLAEAEVLIMDDQSTETRFEARRKLGGHIKQFTVGDAMRVHHKGRKAVTIPTFRRLLCMFNSEVENIAILPPMDESLSGKIMLLLCARGKLHVDRLKNQAMLEREAPALCHYLDNYKVPARITKPQACRCSLCVNQTDDADVARFGFRTFHHPELVEALTSISPEHSLWSILTQAFHGANLPDGYFEGTSEEIEIEVSKTAFNSALAGLRTFPGAVGTYLGRIASRRDGRVEKSTVNGINQWRVYPKGGKE